MEAMEREVEWVFGALDGEGMGEKVYLGLERQG